MDKSTMWHEIRLDTNTVYNLQKLTLAFMRCTGSNAFPEPKHSHLWKAFWARLPHHHHSSGPGLTRSQCTWAECHRSFLFHPPLLHLQRGTTASSNHSSNKDTILLEKATARHICLSYFSSKTSLIIPTRVHIAAGDILRHIRHT